MQQKSMHTEPHKKNKICKGLMRVMRKINLNKNQYLQHNKQR